MIYLRCQSLVQVQVAFMVSTTSFSHTVPSTKETPSSVLGTTTNREVYDTSSPSAPSSRRTSKITVEYGNPSKQSTKEYERLPRNAEVYGTAAKHPFVPSTQAPPPSFHNASKPSRNQQRGTPIVPPTPSHHSQVNLTDFYADPNATAVLGTAPTYARWPPATAGSNATVAERSAPQQWGAAATISNDKVNDADRVKLLQQICTNAHPTQLYHNLVKIGQE